ncbi:hypothetical protein DL98DRAFT_312406 [Cadophora sp. DSE1049]|nr:hypothetical protein DL98DRAFT_312406 [Cadophora sp. DSE1049]
MHCCFWLPSMIHGARHNQKLGAFGAFVNNDAAAHDVWQQEAGARYNHERFLQIQHQIQPPDWPAMIQSPFQSSTLQLPTNLDFDCARMSRNNRHQSNPFHHRGRDRYDPPFPPNFRQAVIDLILGGLGDPGYRGLGSPGRFDGVPNYPDYLDPQDFPPRRNFASGDGGSEPQALRPTDRNRHPRTNMAGQGKEGQPIGKAMKKLFKLLGEAEEAYRDFQEKFDSDTENIKPYAKTASLVELWQRKVDGKKAHADDEDTAETSEGFAAKTHEGMKKKLASALSTAIRSTVGEDNGTRAAIRLEDADRLQQKVETANAQIMDLLNKMPKNREYCVSLLNEFAVLKEMIDPGKDANKKVYRLGDSADEGASDAEGGDDENDGFY